ncbi:uncharacterized protein BX663DRAFT_538620 [Cokeromyces recurvatus]|uniref:uncharacterized protein n=1 Tax=Cokeromyces recurvatus TaxID=90255 RepID=UPI00221F6B95|nr:uncharacterized protein BX663DRAFT_538620 [Cokeromyces recurvatus]KAI7898261.1 hypothetical protein BX663DRAFT_538620 [Cokeromyces recurvatus]
MTSIKLKLANTFATLLLITTQGFVCFNWFLKHSYEIGPKDFNIVLISILQLLLIGFTIYQYLPSSPKDVYEAIGYWYLLVAIMNSSIAYLWFFNMNLFAFIGLLWQLAALLVIYHRLDKYPLEIIIHILIIVIIGFISLHLIDYSHRKDWIHALATAWLLLGASIFSTDNDTIHTILLITVGILSSSVARTLIPNWLEKLNRRFSSWTRRLSERTPLLG